MPTALRAGVSTPALALAVSLSLAPGAGAALTAAEAWRQWQDLAAASDIALSAGAETASAGQLVVSEVAYTTETEDGATVTGTIAAITFAETGSDRVVVTLPTEMPFTVSGEGEDGAPYLARFLAALAGAEITMAEDGTGASVLGTAAPEIRVTLEGVTVDGTAQDIAFAATLSGVTSENRTGAGDLPAVSGRFAADAATLAFAGTDVEEGGSFQMRVEMAEIASQSSGTGSTLLALPGDLGAAVAAGFATSGSGSVGRVAFALATRDVPDAVAIEGSMGGATGRIDIDAQAVDYEIAYDDLAVAVSGGGMPMARATGSLGALRTRLAVPVETGGEAGPMALTVALRDLALGEEVWSLIDPAGVLPRDPATLVIDLAGRARAVGDVLGARMEAPGEVPLEVDRLDVRELRLALAGALLTGTGGFDADWSAPGPYGPGTPALDGTLSLTLTGGEALLQGLIRMGLIREEDAMMARMMTGMLARPGAGPDELISEITVRPDGSVLANGAPLPF